MSELGTIGIWTRQFEDSPAAQAQRAAVELEQLGYGAIWFGEAFGREALTHAGLLLGVTSKIVIATGIANIYARDPVAMAAGQKTLSEAYPGQTGRHHARLSRCNGSGAIPLGPAHCQAGSRAGRARAEDARTGRPTH